MTNIKKRRDSNLELLRIISMCGIISMHYFGMGGAVQNSVFPNFSWFFTHFINSLAIPLVNGFVLITGYFIVDKQMFSLKKPIELLIITATYGIISYLVYLCVGGSSSVKGALEALFPFIIGKRWFVETYIILILFAPFINKALSLLNHKQYRLLLLLQIVVFCLWYSLGLSAPILDDGYGIINFITLYMIGGYIRYYGEDKLFVWNQSKYLVVFFVCVATTFLLSYFINPYGYAFITNIIGSYSLLSSNNSYKVSCFQVETNVAKNTIFFFFLFLNLRIENA